MATKEYLHNLDLVKVAQLINARLHNVTDAEQAALAATLGPDNKGLVVYNTTQNAPYTWSGAAFDRGAVDVAGDVIFRGVLLAASYDTNPAFMAAGSQYVAGEAGTLAFPDVTTYVPSANVEAGDQLLFTAPDAVYVVQRNDAQATEAGLGNVRLATQPEANAGANDIAAMTPLKTHTKLINGKYTRQYEATVNLVALTPLNINHGLKLVDRNSFTITTHFNNQETSVQVNSVDVDNLTLTSLVARNGVRVVIHGASTV